MVLKNKHKVILGVSAFLLLVIVVLGVRYQRAQNGVGSFSPATPESALGDLTDVSTAGQVNGNVLTSNGTTWSAVAPGGGGASLGNFASIVSSTYEDTTGARMATGSIRIVSDPSDFESDNFTIDNGSNSTVFSFSFSGASFSPGNTVIDSGGGPNQRTMMQRILAAITGSVSLGIIAHCDNYTTFEDFGTFLTTCSTINEFGQMVTDTLYLVNPVAGTIGNVSITASTSMFEFVGMSGGTN